MDKLFLVLLLGYIVTVIYLVSEVISEQRLRRLYQELCMDLYEIIHKQGKEYLERIIQQGEINGQ